jgi:hypothetical protein
LSRPFAVTWLLRWAWKAASSDTPRRRMTPSIFISSSARWMVATPTTSMSRLVAKLLEVVIMWYARSRTDMVRPSCFATSWLGSQSRLRVKGRFSTMLVNLLRTWTGASAVSRPRATSP